MALLHLQYSNITKFTKWIKSTEKKKKRIKIYNGQYKHKDATRTRHWIRSKVDLIHLCVPSVFVNQKMKKSSTRKKITSQHDTNSAPTDTNQPFCPTKTRNIDYVFIICMQICVYYLKRIQIWDKRKFISRYKSELFEFLLLPRSFVRSFVCVLLFFLSAFFLSFLCDFLAILFVRGVHVSFGIFFRSLVVFAFHAVM